MAISPDGRLAGSGGYDQSVKIWDLETYQEIHTFRGHWGRVNSIIITPDGRFAISGAGDRTVRFWALAEMQHYRTMTGHTNEVLTLALSADGQILASAGDDGSIYLWEVDSGRRRQVLSTHNKLITSLSFSSDGRFLASKSADGRVILWHTDTWQTAVTLTEPHSGFSFASLAFHPTALVLATQGHNEKMIRIWDLDKSLLLATKKERLASFASPSLAAAGDLSQSAALR